VTVRIIGATCLVAACKRPVWKDGVCSPCWYAGYRTHDLEPGVTVERCPDCVPMGWTR
jgi:NMD protein affecting ribosome stability and mRNA decay